MAENAAKHAERAARIAREAATRAQSFASENRAGYLAEAEATAESTRHEESAARDRYHDAERAVRDRQPDNRTRP